MDTLIHNMFATVIQAQNNIHPVLWFVLEKMGRAIIVYLFLVIALRLGGKRELSQLNPFDLVLLLVLSNAVQNAIIGNETTVTGGIIGAGTLLITNYLIVRFLYTQKWLDKFVEGKSEQLIVEGELKHDVLKKELITHTALERAAQRQGIRSLKDVDSATIDTEGVISFIQKEPLPEDKRQLELLDRIRELEQKIDQLIASK